MATTTAPFKVTKRDIARWWLGNMAFSAFHVLNSGIRLATFKRWWPLSGPMEGKAWRFYLWLATYAWPYCEWRAGRMP